MALEQLEDEKNEGCFLGGGEMGALMRSIDWSKTVLGPVEAWPQSLRTAISIMLNSGFAMVVAWGPEFRFFYNDRYRPVLGASKHPGALGTPSHEIFPEAWPFIGPLFESTRRGEMVALDDELIPLDRYGYLENCYFTFSYSPIRDETGGVGGMLAVVAETTERIEGERRLKTLRDLARRASEAKTTEEACASAAATLSENSIDLPFALLYLLDSEGKRAELINITGLERGTKASPEVIDLEIPDQDGWPLGDVVAERKTKVLTDLGELFGPLSGGPYPEHTHTAVLVPMVRPGQPHPDGVLVFGVSPRRALDNRYLDFYELAADHILTGIRNALAYQEERQRAEQLAELDRAKTAFFSNVSHEFRTPLTLMMGPLEEILEESEKSLPDGPREKIELIYRNSLRLLKLVNTLLDFSRIEAGRIEASYEPVDLASLTSELASVFRSAVEKAGLRLKVDCPPLPESIYVDREMWEKIVLNLLSNAFKYTFDGEIKVSLHLAGDQVEMRVSDTGIGISEKEMPHLFKRFHRIRVERSRTNEGSGIGLALVLELVKLHGGTIRVESFMGVGSTFIVTIPTGKTHLPADRVKASHPTAGKAHGAAHYIEEALRWLPDDSPANFSDSEEWFNREGTRDTETCILLADDNADMREYLKRILSQKWEVEAVADGFSALKAARRLHPDLILTDIMMPGIDGFGLLQELRADPDTKTIPIILLSARAGEESKVEGLAAGADDYLVKPFSARELIARVGAHLEIAKIRREAAKQAEELYQKAQEAARREQEARKRSEDANQMKDEFIATVSHELRTPLTAMLGWIRLLRTGKLDSTASVQAFETIERNVRSQAQLIEDLLDISRIVSGKLRLDTQPLELNTVIRAAVDAVRPAADAKNIEILTSQDQIISNIWGDSERLQQVVWNLLSNAIKFTPKGGQIFIEVAPVGSFAEITVIDTGEGIEPEFLPHIFDRFAQADSALKRTHTGLGLGLAIVKHIVELHGGMIEASSKGKGEGAKFKLKLPLMVTPEKPEKLEREFLPEESNESLQCPPSLIGLKILVVDDELDTLEMINVIFEQCQSEVRTASSVEEALQIFDQWLPDVLISDIGMPGQNGFDLIRKIRSRDPKSGGNIPAIALTAYARIEDRMRVLAAGYQMHVPKPIEPNEIITIVSGLTNIIKK